MQLVIAVFVRLVGCDVLFLDLGGQDCFLKIELIEDERILMLKCFFNQNKLRTKYLNHL